MSAASKPSPTGTTASYLSAQDVACRPATAATLRTGSVRQGGSSSGQVAGHTVPPRTPFYYYSSQDQGPKESPIGHMEIGRGAQVGALLPLTIPELALKTCWPSMIAMAVR